MSQRFEFTKDNSLFELCATAPYRGSFVAHGADLILDGHDHNFQRSHQLRCVDVDTTTSSCIVDTDSDFQAEAGAVIVVSGWAGRPGYDVSGSDPEAGYFATFGAPNQTGWTRGYLTMVATA